MNNFFNFKIGIEASQLPSHRLEWFGWNNKNKGGFYRSLAPQMMMIVKSFMVLLTFFVFGLGNELQSQNCPTPANLQAPNVGITQATVTWNVVQQAQSYRLSYRNIGNNNWTNLNGIIPNSQLLTNLTPATTYEFRVRTDCQQGMSQWSSVALFTTGACAAPLMITADSLTDVSAYICWTSSPNAQAYNLRFRKIGDPNWITIANLNNLCYSLYGLSMATDYEIQVQSVCGLGTAGTSQNEVSNWENLLNFTTTNCKSPINVNAFRQDPTNYVVRWDSVMNATEYSIKYRRVGGGNWTTIEHISDNFVILTGLIPGESYEVKVKTICDEANASDWGNKISFTVEGCPIPTGLTVLQNNDNSITVGWNFMGNPVNGYDVRYRKIGNNNWTNRNNVNNPYTITGLNTGDTYEIIVRSECGNLKSDWSTKVNGTAINCGKVEVVLIEVLDSLNVRAVWNQVPATEYLFRIRKAGDANWTQSNTNDTSKILTGLEPCEIYELEVETRCGNWSGGTSILSSFTAPNPNILQNIFLGPDTTITMDDIDLDAGFPGKRYLWSTGDTTQKIEARPDPNKLHTRIDVTVFDGKCPIAMGTIRLTRGTDNPSVIFDRFGKTYSTDDIDPPIHCTVQAPSLNGEVHPKFSISFSDLGNPIATPQNPIQVNPTEKNFDARNPILGPIWFGFGGPNPIGEIRRALVCKLFEDLSAMFVSPVGNPDPIIVRIGSGDLGVGVLGNASAYYTWWGINMNGIIDGESYKTLTSGKDSYATYPQIAGYKRGSTAHMYVNFAIDDPSKTILDERFNLDILSTGVLPSGKYDMYSIGLHEALHGLGFASLMQADGSGFKVVENLRGVSRVYARFDEFLKYNRGNNNSLITTTPYSPAFAYPDPLPPAPVPPPSSYISTNCSNGPVVRFDGPYTNNVNIYTSNNGQFQEGSSLSHVFSEANCSSNTACNDVMCFSLSKEPRRHIRQEEYEILCDLGYMLTKIYGVPLPNQPSSDINTSNYYNDYTPCTNGTNSK